MMNNHTGEEALSFIRKSVMPIIDKHPQFRMVPDSYTHTVKFMGDIRVSVDELVPILKRVISSAQRVSIYSHIPFCKYRCTFCHYPIVVRSGATDYESEIKSIIGESDIFRRVVPEVSTVPVSSLYLGGGTPTLMNRQEISKLLSHFRKCYQMSDSCEISTEGSPDSLTPERIQDLLDLGINRLSIGVQTLNDNLLKKCNRQHTAADAIHAITRAARADFKDLNVDLIYGLPGQSLEQFITDITRSVDLGATSITIYRLRLGRADEIPTTQMHAWYQMRPNDFPSLELIYAMQYAARLTLIARGYAEGPSGWYSLPKHRPQVYDDRWRDQIPLVAYGWWTYSYSRDYEYRNHSSHSSHKEDVSVGRLPIVSSSIFDGAEALRRVIAFRLKSTFSTDAKLANQLTCKATGARLTDVLCNLGLAEIDSDIFELTIPGQILIEEIIGHLIL